MPMYDREENDLMVVQLWADVQILAPTDLDALDLICNLWNEEEQLCCQRCGTEVARAQGHRNVDCSGCGKTTSVTTQTLLCKARRFKVYLLACLIREQGLFISGAALAKLTVVASATAYNLVRKFNIAISNQMPAETQEVSARFFEKLIAKRSRMTPAEMHPFAEQEIIEQELAAEHEKTANFPADIEDEETTFDERQKTDPEIVRKIIRKMLSDKGITVDSICDLTGISIGLVTGALIMLTMDGETTELSGGRFIKKELSVTEKFLAANDLVSEKIETTVKNLSTQIIKYHHRVSRKGLQLFFAPMWCALDRMVWGKGSMVRLCRKHPPISYRQMLKYSSPPLLKIMLC